MSSHIPKPLHNIGMGLGQALDLLWCQSLPAFSALPLTKKALAVARPLAKAFLGFLPGQFAKVAETNGLGNPVGLIRQLEKPGGAGEGG